MDKRHTYVEVLDDDAQSFDWVCSTIESLGGTPRVWESALSFQEFAKNNTINCLIVGHHLPGINADVVLSHLQLYEDAHLSVVVTSNISVRTAVRMMHHGAFDVITRPRESDRLQKDIREITNNSLETFEARDNLRMWKRELLELNELEQQIARGMTAGVPNAVLAARLGLGVRTVEKYRRQVFDKFNARTIPDLVKVFYEIAPHLLDLEPVQRVAS